VTNETPLELRELHQLRSKYSNHNYQLTPFLRLTRWLLGDDTKGVVLFDGGLSTSKATVSIFSNVNVLGFLISTLIVVVIYSSVSAESGSVVWCGACNAE
jgi:hypothetical protein